MRMNTLATLISVSTKYDPSSGKHVTTQTRHDLRVVTTNTGAEVQMRLWGNVQEDRLTMRTLQPIKVKFDLVEINERTYKLSMPINHLTKSTYYLEEVAT